SFAIRSATRRAVPTPAGKPWFYLPTSSAWVGSVGPGRRLTGPLHNPLAGGHRKPMRPVVKGVALDPQSRCAHWRGPLDIVAIRMRCCGTWYACRQCHDELAGHAAAVWPVAEWDEPAVLCGACGTELSIRDYLACANR